MTTVATFVDQVVKEYAACEDSRDGKDRKAVLDHLGRMLSACRVLITHVGIEITRLEE